MANEIGAQSLSRLRPGDECVILGTNLGWGPTRHLWDLGLLPGTKVRILANFAPFGPLVVEAGESKIALGGTAASRIMVKSVRS